MALPFFPPILPRAALAAKTIGFNDCGGGVFGRRVQRCDSRLQRRDPRLGRLLPGARVGGQFRHRVHLVAPHQVQPANCLVNACPHHRLDFLADPHQRGQRAAGHTSNVIENPGALGHVSRSASWGYEQYTLDLATKPRENNPRAALLSHGFVIRVGFVTRMSDRFPLPPYQWPAPYRAGAIVSINVEGEAPLAWRHRGETLQALGELELRRFGPRVGAWRLLDLLDETGHKSSFFVSGLVADAYPTLAPAITARGHEVALHGWYHEAVTEISYQGNETSLARAIGLLHAQTGHRPVGYRAPGWDITAVGHELLRTAGLLYDSTLQGLEHPYGFAGLTEIPASDRATATGLIVAAPRAAEMMTSSCLVSM